MRAQTTQLNDRKDEWADWKAKSMTKRLHESTARLKVFLQATGTHVGSHAFGGFSIISCLHASASASGNNKQKSIPLSAEWDIKTHPEAAFTARSLPRRSSRVGLWSVNISVNTKAKTAHSWQKLRTLKFYYGKSHFACSPAYMAKANARWPFFKGKGETHDSKP